MKKLIVCIMAIFICSIATFGQNVVYVNPSSAINGNGSSWANAYNNLPDAIANAPQNSEVWLSKSAQLFSSKGLQANYISLNKKLGIYGGFIGTENSKTQRLVGSKSIISGDLTQLNTNSGNSFIALHITNQVTIDGVSFQFFNCPSTNTGIILADTNAIVNLSFVSFKSNEGGSRGGICVNASKNANVRMDSVTVINNISNGNGVLCSRSDRATFQIRNSIFKDNGLSGGDGFVIYASFNNSITPAFNESIPISLYNSSFINNGLAIDFNYFGSSYYKKCNFILKPSSNNTFHVAADSATMVFDSCNIQGEISNYLIYSSNLKKLALTNTKIFNITNPSSSYIIYSYNTRVEFTNSTFNDLTGSYVFFLNSQNGKINLNNCNFIGSSASSYYLYVYAKTFVTQNCIFKNINVTSGNYYYVDSAYVGKTTFDSTTTNDFFYTQNISKAVFDSCSISNFTQNQPLFYTNSPNKLLVKNSTIQNITQTSNNSGAPILFWNYDGNVQSTNNTIDHIYTSGPLIDNRKNMTVFGNVFKNISTDSALFLNSGKLQVFNSNFVNTTTTSFQNDTVYGSQNTVSLKLINSILYSTSPRLIKVRVNPVKYFDTLSNCLTNQSLAGSNMYNFVTTSYANLYNSSTSPLIQDKGKDLVDIYLVPNKDIFGNTRIKFGKIDIGAIEIQNQIPTEIQTTQSVYSTYKITYYPNPAEDVLVVDVDEMTNATIVDLKGEVKRVLSLKSGINQISTIGLPEGMYVLRVQSETGLTMVKWIKK